MFKCLVGGFQTARNLTTGIVTFQPEARLPYHTHPFSESVTLLEGQATLEVEPKTGAVVQVFTTGTMVQVYLLAGSVPTDSWSGSDLKISLPKTDGLNPDGPKV